MNKLAGHEPNRVVWMNQWALLLIIGFISIFTATGFVEPAKAHPFLNSAEPQCNGNDPTILMCDDYEDGTWFVTNADTAGGSGNPLNQGWAGTIYATDPLKQNFARCGGQGAVGTNCTATTAYRNQSGKGGQAWHRLGPQTATNYMNVYHREYLKFSPGYKFGHEKWTFYEDGTTQHGLTQTPFGSDMFDWAQQQGRGCPGLRCAQNQGKDLHMIPGHWYYMETHLDLANGLVEFWQDDCGTNGLGCTGPGTLRLRHTGLTWSNTSKGCCNFHQENWCPAPGGAGECAGEVYRDQTVWATRRIGPMGAPGGDTTAPAPVTGLMILP